MYNALKQSTAAQSIKVGPVVDNTGAWVISAVVADFKAAAAGGALSALDGSATASYDAAGMYTLVLTANDTATLGRLVVQCVKASTICPPSRYQVCPAAIYDTLVSGTPSKGGLPMLDAATGLVQTGYGGAPATVGKSPATLAAGDVSGKLPATIAVSDITGGAVPLPASGSMPETANTSSKLDVAVGSRMASFTYTAPDNTSIGSVLTALQNGAYGLSALQTLLAAAATASGQTAILNAINGLTRQTARSMPTVGSQWLRPVTGTATQGVQLHLYNAAGENEDPDSNAVTVHAGSTAGGTDYDSLLSSTAMTKTATGLYLVTFSVAGRDQVTPLPLGDVYFAFSWTRTEMVNGGSTAVHGTDAAAVSVVDVLQGATLDAIGKAVGATADIAAGQPGGLPLNDPATGLVGASVGESQCADVVNLLKSIALGQVMVQDGLGNNYYPAGSRYGRTYYLSAGGSLYRFYYDQDSIRWFFGRDFVPANAINSGPADGSFVGEYLAGPAPSGTTFTNSANPLPTDAAAAITAFLSTTIPDSDPAITYGDAIALVQSRAAVGAKMDLADSLNTTGVADLKTKLGTMPASGNWTTTANLPTGFSTWTIAGGGTAIGNSTFTAGGNVFATNMVTLPNDGNYLSAAQKASLTAAGSGTWYNAPSGWATPTNVSDAATAIMEHGDANWESGGAGGGLTDEQAAQLTTAANKPITIVTPIVGVVPPAVQDVTLVPGYQFGEYSTVLAVIDGSAQPVALTGRTLEMKFADSSDPATSLFALSTTGAAGDNLVIDGTTTNDLHITIAATHNSTARLYRWVLWDMTITGKPEGLMRGTLLIGVNPQP